MTQRPISRGTSQDLTLHCLDQLGRPVEIEATFHYDPHDPYAVELAFHAAGSDVSWWMARTLLLRGLAGPEGEGDVLVWPSVDEDSRAVLVMEFRSPDGHLLAQADSEALQAFLGRTLTAVPIGTESEHLDLDALTHYLLAS
ncbi:SsgA family sporulation/cell division regulator [Nocardioides ferulae]|uniref:SsgA family sporulation/cell division regulator n=1 Tax=Nocardioides ferulae TaxID=2340821 RepID=UPI000EB2CE08|nr:SsgA family sporulation/cell division regulator [Nocardioides ferulae]